MAHIFISYSHADLAMARELRDRLESEAFPVWMDESRLMVGDDFAVEITRRIRDCSALALLITASTKNSSYVPIEVSLAHHFGRPILPLLIDETGLTDQILPYVVRLHQGRVEWAELLRRIPSVLREIMSGRLESVEVQAKPSISVCSPVPKAAHESDVACGLLITCAQYEEFAAKAFEGGFLPRGRALPTRGKPDQPVAGIDWDDAVAYCDWAGGVLPCTGEALLDDDLAEWLDAGDQSRKYVADVRTGELLGLVNRSSSPPRVGFRCVPIRESGEAGFVRVEVTDRRPTPRWDQGFAALMDRFHIPWKIRRPLLERRRGQECPRVFELARYAVTNAQYLAFVRQTKKAKLPTHWSGVWQKRFGTPFPPRLALLPVTHVTYADACSYAAWQKCRLPISAEWECAVAGAKNHQYPWGNEYESRYCNSVESGRGGLLRVDDLPAGDNEFAARQLCGNVWEWTVAEEGEPEVRGGSWRVACEVWGQAFAYRTLSAVDNLDDVGFRIARNI